MVADLDLMIQLKPLFQKQIFFLLCNKYGGSIKAGRVLDIPASSVRGYKNLYSNSVPIYILDKLAELKITSNNDINSNTLKSFSKKDQRKIILINGANKRCDNLRNLKESLPSIKQLIKSNRLDFLKWFEIYSKLTTTGFRKLTYSASKGIVKISYTNFNGIKIKDFEVLIPQKFLLDEEFFYFFGLWCGDKSGGKRFGVCNQNLKILEFSEYFLSKIFQRTQRVLVIKDGEPTPKIKFDKKVVVNSKGTGWVLSIYSTNGILSSFFDYLQKSLEEFLYLTKNKNPFFAGLFDAEGNVSLYNRSFRWACKNNFLIPIYLRYLKEMNLFKSYDGGCLVTYNSKGFYNKIFPYMKHSSKLKLTSFLLTGENIPREYKKILVYIKNHPFQDQSSIAKALKKNKVYSELRLLTKLGFILTKGYPHKFNLTQKSLKLLGETKL